MKKVRDFDGAFESFKQRICAMDDDAFFELLGTSIEELKNAQETFERVHSQAEFSYTIARKKYFQESTLISCGLPPSQCRIQIKPNIESTRSIPIDIQRHRLSEKLEIRYVLDKSRSIADIDLIGA